MSADLPPLIGHLPPRGEATPEALLEGFLEYLVDAGIEPYPAQEEAFLELFSGKHVILNTPTGSGKSLVALALAFKALAEDASCFYTAPIKALVSEKFFSLCEDLGASNVGMMTGDASVNREAPIIVCTAEILANLALREGEGADAAYVVMDEFHFYSDRERGWAWQVPLLALPKARFLLMSATLGETRWLEDALEETTDGDVALVKSSDRPVPLDYEYTELPILSTISRLLEQKLTPIYIVHFTQRAAAERAQDLMSIDFLTKDEKARIKKSLRGFRWSTPFGKELSRWVHHGIGVHHAGMLPKYRRAVERLAQEGLLRIICGTDTLGVGVNVPIRTVLFTQLCKYDGEKTAVLSVRDFQQIAGRAGRRGYDDRGLVVAQAPDHVVENKKLLAKAGDDPKKQRRVRLKKPPERGYAHFDEKTFDRLRGGEPERLVSRFRVSHGMVLDVLSRGDGGCRDLRGLIRRSHDDRTKQFREGRKAIAMIRALREAGILSKDARGLYLANELQDEFSLHTALGLYLVEALDVLDPESPEYALDVITFVEAICEDPHVVLRQQVDVAKTRALSAMKAEGLEYEERMAKLEQIDRPKPLVDLMYGTYNAYAEHHPWIGSDSLSPKSVVRELLEEGDDFVGYVKAYGLKRSEGVLLRYFTEVYKMLVQTVPESRKDERLEELIAALGALVRSVDASLIAEWEKLAAGADAPTEAEEDAGDKPFDLTADKRAFTVLVRNAAFRVVRALARHDYARAVDGLAGGSLVAPALEEALAPFYEEFERIEDGPDARAPSLFQLEKGAERWTLRQTLLDADESGAFALRFVIDLAAVREAGRLELRLEEVERA